MASGPFAGSTAATTPFALSDYRSSARDEAEALDRRATRLTTDAMGYNTNSDNYVMTIVLFSTVLFFSNFAAKLADTAARTIAVAGAGCVIVAGLVNLLVLPVF